MSWSKSKFNDKDCFIFSIVGSKGIEPFDQTYKIQSPRPGNCPLNYRKISFLNKEIITTSHNRQYYYSYIVLSKTKYR